MAVLLLTPACLQLLTVPYLIDNPEVGYVQARWTFANPDESYLTKEGPQTLQQACLQAHAPNSQGLC